MTKATFIQPLHLGNRNSLHNVIEEITKKATVKSSCGIQALQRRYVFISW